MTAPVRGYGECEHGSLPGKCEVCNLTAQLYAAERANRRLRERVRKLELAARYPEDR